MAVRTSLIRRPRDDSCSDERPEPLRENLRRDAEIGLQLVEALEAQVQVAHDEGTPPLANRVECARERAVHGAKRSPLHAISVANRVA
jgi:hypothetical protein